MDLNKCQNLFEYTKIRRKKLHRSTVTTFWRAPFYFILTETVFESKREKRNAVLYFTLIPMVYPIIHHTCTLNRISIKIIFELVYLSYVCESSKYRAFYDKKSLSCSFSLLIRWRWESWPWITINFSWEFFACSPCITCTLLFILKLKVNKMIIKEE